MIDVLFKFPIVMIDGDNEERKARNKPDLGRLPNMEEEEEEYDIVYGEAEYPYWDFIGVEDRWLPTVESFRKALDQKFEGCVVRFLHAGQLIVPWPKEKFKAEIIKFKEEYESKHEVKKQEKRQDIRVLTIPLEQYKAVIGDGDNKPTDE